jgi:hypothetical protein
MSGSQQQDQQQQTHQNTDPWAPQQGYLTQGFNQAAGALTKAQGAPDPTGFVAQMTPDQLSTFQRMLGFGTNSNAGAAQGAAGNSLTNAGVGGVQNAITGYTNFDPSATNSVDNAIAGGNKYSAGLDIPGQVNAAMRDARQQVGDVTLPGIEANAAVNGNTNSSRTGVAQGLVERGLAQQAGDLSATLRNSAFNTGAALSTDIAGQNNASKLAALGGAAGAGGAAAGTGINALGQSVNTQGGLYDIANQGGAGEQANTQLGYDASNAAHQYGVNSPFDALNNYWKIVGSNNWGGQTQGTQSTQTTTTPSAWQVIGGLLGAGGSLMGSRPGALGGGSGFLGAFG